jgi:WD40 repeat protein
MRLLDRKEHSVLVGYQDWIYTVCRNANGHVLLASGGGGTVQLWDRVPVGNTNAATICQELPASISVRHSLGEVPDGRKQRDTCVTVKNRSSDRRQCRSVCAVSLATICELSFMRRCFFPLGSL